MEWQGLVEQRLVAEWERLGVERWIEQQAVGVPIPVGDGGELDFVERSTEGTRKAHTPYTLRS